MIIFHLIKIVHTLGNMKRKAFIDKSTLGISSLLISPSVFAKKSNLYISDSMSSEAFAIATWDVKRAVTTAGKSLDSGANALEAAVSGTAIEEADILNTTVGKGGAPDREGTVSLDACVMDSNGNCGAVLAVENITHVAALAKDVMEKTPHVILAGDGARKFAVEQGYKTEDLL